jgi:hypothetical protein
MMDDATTLFSVADEMTGLSNTDAQPSRLAIRLWQKRLHSIAMTLLKTEAAVPPPRIGSVRNSLVILQGGRASK